MALTWYTSPCPSARKRGSANIRRSAFGVRVASRGSQMGNKLNSQSVVGKAKKSGAHQHTLSPTSAWSCDSAYAIDFSPWRRLVSVKQMLPRSHCSSVYSLSNLIHMSLKPNVERGTTWDTEARLVSEWAFVEIEKDERRVATTHQGQPSIDGNRNLHLLRLRAGIVQAYRIRPRRW